MRPAGFEPATCRLGTDCSILLSYGRDWGRSLRSRLRERAIAFAGRRGASRMQASMQEFCSSQVTSCPPQSLPVTPSNRCLSRQTGRIVDWVMMRRSFASCWRIALACGGCLRYKQRLGNRSQGDAIILLVKDLRSSECDACRSACRSYGLRFLGLAALWPLLSFDAQSAIITLAADSIDGEGRGGT